MPDSSVLVIEDHELFAESLEVVLGQHGYTVRSLRLGPADEATGRLLAAALGINADIVLLDLDLGPHGDGGQLIRPLTRAGARVVVVTGNLDRSRWGGCLRHGARAVVPKQRPMSELLEVVRRLDARQPVLTQEEYDDLTSRWQRTMAEDEDFRQRLARLSHREQQVLGELVAGHTVREIARQHVVSQETVRTQVRSILHKLRVSTQIAAVGLAHRVGWRPPGGHDPAGARPTA